MNAFDEELRLRLDALETQGLRRELRALQSQPGPVAQIDGTPALNFSSNDYLGLAGAPELKAAAMAALERFGTGAGAARLLYGSLPPHAELESALAEFKRAEAALAFSSGYATALGTLGALLGKDDVVVLDKLAHACIVDAARLSGAKLRVFAHNDLGQLEEILKWAEGRAGRVLIVTESLFSMDGDHAPLRELVALKERFGAWLMVDEAHSTGLYGAHGRGLAQELGVAGGIEVQMGTLGKALGTAGGYICGSRALVEYLLNRARSFVFSTAPPPAIAAAAAAAVRLVQTARGDELRRELWDRAQHLRAAFPERARGSRLRSPIFPWLIGDESETVRVGAQLRRNGILVGAVRYPTVARGAARLRITLSAAHTPEQLGKLCERLALDTIPSV